MEKGKLYDGLSDLPTVFGGARADRFHSNQAARKTTGSI
jgi:hypothetical protein